MLAQLRRHHDEFEARGAAVMAVGGASRSQARRLLGAGCPFPLLVDPEGRLRRTLGIDQQLTWAELLGWHSIRNLLVGMVRQRQGRVSRPHTDDRPAVVVLDAERRLLWAHVGRAVGDYPSVQQVLAAIPALDAEGSGP